MTTITSAAHPLALRTLSKFKIMKLREYGLYSKAEKCKFGERKAGFLGIVVSFDEIEMMVDRIAAIEDWPTPTSVKASR